MCGSMCYHTRMKVIRYAITCLLMVLAMPAPAQEDTVKLTVSGIASTNAYEVGKPFEIALQGQAPATWHAYYRNPGTVGESMKAYLQAPPGFCVEGPFWQVPALHKTSSGSVAYIYERPVVIWRLTPQANAPEHANFVLRAAAQLCADTCLPTQKTQTQLELTRGEATPNPEWKGLEQQVETLGDTPLQAVSAQRVPGGVALRFAHASGEVKDAYFFSDDNSIAPQAPQKPVKTEDGYELLLTYNDGKDVMYPAPEKPNRDRLTGMLTLGDGTHTRVEVDVAPASLSMPDNLWEVLVGLFLGGLLLNLMPCVFPVLGLKIMSFVSLGGGSKRRVVLHSVVFSLGIVLSFWVLGLVLVGLSNAELLMQTPWHEWPSVMFGDAGSTERSWATWMESEWVVYGIMLLLLVLGLSMYGVFEIGARATGIGSELQQKGGYTGSFFQGCLITLVATPCSAPFLGSAITIAMSLPAVWMLVSLTGMALGLALPYLLLSVFPVLVRLLPKPGAWMESLKQAMSFLLFAAAAWMLDVYLSHLTADTMWVLISLVVFCSAFWVFGRWCPLYRSRLSRWLGLLVALLLLAAGVYGSMPRHPDDKWEPWTPEAMAEALEDGVPVYVDFTAKWCTTCQANKKLGYSDEVYALMSKYDVVLLRADKTKPNPAIDAELRRLHRSAVPTNALYLPGKEPAVTSELLTPGYLLDFLKEHLEHQD